MPEEIAVALASFFSDDDWPAVFDAEAGCFVVHFNGSQAQWTCLAYPVEDDRQFLFYSRAPVHADEEHLAAAAEYLARANYGLVLGNFELDFDDGEVRYKTSIDVGGGELTPELIRPVVYANVQAMDRYLSGLMLVLVDGASPAEAVERVEAETEDSPGGLATP